MICPSVAVICSHVVDDRYPCSAWKVPATYSSQEQQYWDSTSGDTTHRQSKVKIATLYKNIFICLPIFHRQILSSKELVLTESWDGIIIHLRCYLLTNTTMYEKSSASHVLPEMTDKYVAPEKIVRSRR